MRSPVRAILSLLAIGAVLVSSACSGEGPATAAPAGVRLVSPTEASSIVADAPEGLVVLDIRTPEEHAAAHLEAATLLDFYEPDFADGLAELDPEVPYILYCRSGNRSAQAARLMADLGFRDVAEVDGGIVAWADAGLPLVAP